jgi:hypothetical protein
MSWDDKFIRGLVSTWNKNEVKGKRRRTEQHLNERSAQVDGEITSKDCARHISAMETNTLYDVILQPAADTQGRGGDCDGDVGDEFRICDGLTAETFQSRVGDDEFEER